MKFTDPLWIAVKLLNDKSLQEGMLMFKHTKMEGGMRVFDELNTAQWWHDTENELVPEVRQLFNRYYTVIEQLLYCYFTITSLLQEAVLLPLLFFPDGTFLSTNGSHTIKPMMMGVGNHPISQLNKLEAKKVMITVI